MTSKRRNIAGIVFAMALAFCGTAVGQTIGAAYDHVVTVKAGKDKYLYVAVAGNFTDSHACTNPYWARSENQFDDPQTQAMLQIALSSLLARAPVHVYTKGCDAQQFPIFTQIQIDERKPPPPAPPPAPPSKSEKELRCAKGKICCGGANPDGTCSTTCLPNTSANRKNCQIK